MKNTILALVLSTLTALAAAPPKEVSYYNAGEFNLNAFGSVATTDFDNSLGSVGVGVDWFFTENVGVGVSTAFEDLNGAPFDNVSARVLYRIPIKQNSVYGFAGGKRLLDDGEWSGFIGIGVERRWAQHFGTFLEWGGEKQISGSRDVSAFGTAGIRLTW